MKKICSMDLLIPDYSQKTNRTRERAFSRIKRIFTDQILFIYNIFKLIVRLLYLIYKQ